MWPRPRGGSRRRPGSRFIYDGLSDERPIDARDPVQPQRYGSGWAPVLVAWSNERETDIPFRAEDDEDAVAVAQPWFAGSDGTIVTGWIVVNEDYQLPPGFSFPGSRGVTLLHEWGHIMGLDHTNSEAEVMHPSGGYATDLGPGDLRRSPRAGHRRGLPHHPDRRGLTSVAGKGTRDYAVAPATWCAHAKPAPWGR